MRSDRGRVSPVKIKPKRWLGIYTSAIALSLVLLVSGLMVKSEGAIAVLAVSGIVLFCAATLSGYIFFRCPSCRKVLPVRGSFGAEYCQYCGETLDPPDSTEK